jgi:SAM-dependent methyltransferase
MAKAALDPVVGFDWAGHWRSLVEGSAGPCHVQRSDPWKDRAEEYHASRGGDWQPLLAVMEPWLDRHKTAIDVGAGTGRHAVPLAARLDWVTAVEPSEAMRSLIPPLDNLTVIASSWEDAEVAPADLVVCSHVIYGVAEPVPFIEKMESCARERLFLVVRDGPGAHEGEARQPRLQDLYNLLRQMGVSPDITVAGDSGVVHWRPPPI